MSERRCRIILAALIWQRVCLAMLECHRHLLVPVLMRWSIAHFRDPQLDYAKLETFMLAGGYLIQTAVATIVTLLVLESLQSSGIRWRRLAIAFAGVLAQADR